MRSCDFHLICVNKCKIQAFGQCELGRQAGETDENTFSLVCCTKYNTTM